MPLLPPSFDTFAKPTGLDIDIKQPTDATLLRTANGSANLKWKKGFKKKWAGKFANAQKWLDNQVLLDCEPYVPLRAGILVFSGILSTKIGSGKVVWGTPYARYQYYGKVMIPSPFGGGNILTKRNLKYHGGGKRGAFWFERAKEVQKDNWVKGVQTIIEQGQA